MKKETINLGKWSIEKINSLLKKSTKFKNPEDKIPFICKQFLDTPYKRTLIGSMDKKESFVINLAGMDCFTLIDYVEAMRLSGSFKEFRENLRRIRYKRGHVCYKSRRHFFTDWSSYKKNTVIDVTKKIGSDLALRVIKRLNLKDDKSFFLEGIAPKKRIIYYVPTKDIDKIINNLKTGDYIGIYSEKDGLDVSHVGIYIKERGQCLFYHASSKKGKVVKESFLKYLEGKKGIIVLRPV